jgi:hypothetical protein
MVLHHSLPLTATHCHSLHILPEYQATLLASAECLPVRARNHQHKPQASMPSVDDHWLHYECAPMLQYRYVQPANRNRQIPARIASNVSAVSRTTTWHDIQAMQSELQCLAVTRQMTLGDWYTVTQELQGVGLGWVASSSSRVSRISYSRSLLRELAKSITCTYLVLNLCMKTCRSYTTRHTVKTLGRCHQ